MKNMAVVAAALLVLTGASTQCAAQDTNAPSAANLPLRSSTELDQLLGPIALYPDPLIGLILPASALPSEIVMADRYLTQGGDPDQIAAQPWDASVQGLAHYPTVLKWMDDNLAWTTELGVAFTSQQADVMDSVQRLRSQAQALGNLPSGPQENVQDDDGMIDIEPTDENDIFVPDYQPGLIYYQPGEYCTFGIGLPIGGWLWYDWDWWHHRLFTWGPGHPRPVGWWHQPPITRRNIIAAQNLSTWRPRPRPASIIIRGGGDRGYQARAFSTTYQAPRTPAPRVSEARRVPTEARRAPSEAPRVSVTTIGRSSEVSRPFERSEPSESVFGGSQTSREVRESSSRGQESRSVSVAPARSSGGSSGHR